MQANIIIILRDVITHTMNGQFLCVTSRDEANSGHIIINYYDIRKQFVVVN